MGNPEGFLSTPSARRATRRRGAWASRTRYFYPRPPRGGRQFTIFGSLSLTAISIHALREEGDVSMFPCSDYIIHISIHALREEGDRITVK